MAITPAQEPKIEFRDTAYALPGGQHLLSGCNFAVAHGETLVLLGRSGSGKTTLLRLVNRLLKPTAGAVLVEGRSTLEWDPIALRRRIGYVIQDAGLFPHFTVEQNVGLVPALQGRPAEEIHNRVCGLLHLVGLPPDEFSARRPSQLSGGQRQRVGVARALAADPPILLMDEPFGALDPITRAELQREFCSLKERLGKTILFVTHDVREALLLGTRIALLEQGRLVALRGRDEFLRAPEPEVQALLQTVRESEPDWK